MRTCRKTFLLALVTTLAAMPLPGQDHGLTPAPRVSIAWNRFYDYGETADLLRALEKAYPDWLRLDSLGKSFEGRDLWVAILNDPEGPPHRAKPAIYIDANVHGNEIQGTEVCLYTLWYLLENKERLPKVRDLLRRVSFYVIPTVNPDGRQHWFDSANTSSSSRSGKAPVDDDRDGMLDEDGPDDLDQDGSITQMRKKVERGGTHVLDREDPRLLVRAPRGKEGDYILLGSEGIDNDGDGEVNEDPPGGYDMNRNWPTDWQPGWLQYGAGDHPLSWPETRAVADFLLAHPNVAALQSYHNAGGMILRGPGAKEVPEYPDPDVQVYDELGQTGQRMLPHYRYMIIWKDLYTVHGGFVNWAFEGLGIFAFTNELWNSDQYFGAAAGRDDRAAGRMLWDDRLELGRTYKDWTPFDHPKYGRIEIGGHQKTSSRVPPLFMLEELCHRNMAFTLYHADEMPLLQVGEPEVTEIASGLWKVRAEVRNDRLIPTVAAHAARHGIGLPDFFEIECPGGRIVTGGLVTGPPLREKTAAVAKRPARLRIPDGVPSRGRVRAEWVIASDTAPASALTLRYVSQKGGTVTWPR